MGNAESSADENLVGYHVLRVQHDNSPAAKAGLQVYFDFIVAANGIPLLKEDQTLVDQLSANENKPMVLTVYNTRTSSMRDVSITPTSDWGGAGLLGVTIRFSSVSQANEHVWHVLEVHPKSPAAEAGLEPLMEYIVGTSDLLFTSEDDLANLVYSNLDRPVVLYVYSTKTEDIRDVTLVPNDKWGGDGCLGAEVGYGFLHRVPLRDEEAEAEAEREASAQAEAQADAQAQAKAVAVQRQRERERENEAARQAETEAAAAARPAAPTLCDPEPVVPDSPVAAPTPTPTPVPAPAPAPETEPEPEAKPEPEPEEGVAGDK